MALLLFPGESWVREEFKVHTAVCFTNPGAKIENCQKAVGTTYWRDRELMGWEKFDVLSYKDVRDWGADLRFDVDMGEAYGHRPYTWSPEQVYGIATSFFGARLWMEMQETMPTNKPLAYLTIFEEGEQGQVLGIFREITTVGRAPESLAFIPAEYDTVSRNHAVITRTIDGFVLEDRSKNGTYVNNRRLTDGEKCLLEEGDVILLGGLKKDKSVCCLQYSRTPPAPLRTTVEGAILPDH
ncbi:MAG: FHA domain-containing protein [Ardenticatenaceae bacterium]|nr:FHA domain-containing protein [Ardenticatenaceae bacterium]